MVNKTDNRSIFRVFKSVWVPSQSDIFSPKFTGIPGAIRATRCQTSLQSNTFEQVVF